uniref:SOSEKI DIX-like domain-containing protein n=1 Tax=Salix viminalis TaxID=40686 RepID=A0A6N2MJA9_SALVM
MAAVSSRGGRNSEGVQIPRNRETSPERCRVVWSESNKLSRKVPVVYYLSRNGQLEHPHFMEVPLSSSDGGLYLRDVINRLDLLRGQGMAGLYSWSSKRSYKNGFVWHDLADDDFIHPAHGHEYVLKGSELLDHSNKQLFLETKPQETRQSSSNSQGSDFPRIARRRNQSWSSIDLNEYKVYKAESPSESSRKLAADASTQTDDSRRRRQAKPVKEELHEEEIKGSQETEVNGEEIIAISPPPSDSSPETLESLMKADGRVILGANGEGSGLNLDQTVGNCGRMKASTVLMQLISCGSISFRDCGATAVKEQGLSLITAQYKGRLPRGGGYSEEHEESSNISRVKLEEKEYFSGSLIETKKEEVHALNLKRSNSYNADRSSQLQLAEKEIEGVRTKCIPRKSRAMATRKESSDNVAADHNNHNNSSGILVGSKRLEVQQVEDVARR